MNTFEQNITNIYGEKGTQWLAELPEIIRQISEVWNLTKVTPVKNLSYNYVLSALRKGLPVILKLSHDIDGLEKEVAALRAFSEYGAAKVLEQKTGALLLERAVPDHSLKGYWPLKDAEAMDITCTVLKRLHQAPLSKNTEFPHIKDWLAALDKDWDIPAPYLEHARLLRDQLLATSSTPVLLHGDLHHDNILSNGNTWIVIDPKGVIGEPAYEAAAFIYNPIPELLDSPDAIPIIEGRIKSFALSLKIDENRLKDWCFVQAVLAWVWCLEDRGNPDYFVRLAVLFEEKIQMVRMRTESDLLENSRK